MALTFDDPDHSHGERRFLTFRMSRRSRLLAVVHTERGSHHRIISARKAGRSERRIYEEG